MLFATQATVASAFELQIITNALEDDLRSTSLLSPLSKPASEATAQDIVASAQADYARLVGLLYDRGFFAPQVSILIDGREAADLSPVQPPRSVRAVVVRVNTGAPFVFGSARVTPTTLGTQLPERFATGQEASTGTMQEAVEAGVDAWRNVGHAKARVASQTITAEHSTNRLNADIRLNPGPRLRFGDLRVSGNSRMRAERVTEIAGLPTGETFSPEEVQRTAARLRRSGVFNVVTLSEAEQISANDTLDIEAQLTEAKLRRFGFGAELSSQDGLMLSGFWLHRNLLGGGERLRVGGEVKGIGGETAGNDYELTLNFTRPATFGKDNDFYTNIEIASLNEPNFTSDRASLEGGIRRFASKEHEYTFGVGYRAARTTDTFGSRSYRILTLPLSAQFDYRDDKLDATKGYYAKVSLTPFVNMRGTANGVRGKLDARAYRSVGANKRVTFAARGQFGFVSGPSLRNAPADFLFYSGGGGTVRGHGFQSLGVDLGGGNVIGGKSFVGLSGEVRVKATDKLSVVGFYDMGLIGAEDFPAESSSRWHSGVGLGVRYDTGIGPIRFDVANPIGSPINIRNVKLYIGIGQSF